MLLGDITGITAVLFVIYHSMVLFSVVLSVHVQDSGCFREKTMVYLSAAICSSPSISTVLESHPFITGKCGLPLYSKLKSDDVGIFI